MNKEHLTGTLSNVRKCWLAMPLGAGFLRWVLAAGCLTIEKKTKLKLLFFSSGTFLTSILSPAAIAQYPVYRQLVPLREQGSSQPLDKTLALLRGGDIF